MGIAAPMRGEERFLVDPHEMAESVKSLINSKEVKATPAETRGVKLQRSESLRAKKEFAEKKEANPILQGKRKRKHKPKYDEDYSIQKFTKFRKKEEEVLVTWVETEQKSWESVDSLMVSYTPLTIEKHLSMLKTRLNRIKDRKKHKSKKPRK